MRKIVFQKIIYYFLEALPYLKVTLTYVVISLLCGFLIGILIANLNMSKNKAARAAANLYLTITRCTPPLVLLFLTYYGLPAILKNSFGIQTGRIEPLAAVSITFSIFVGSSSSEMIRAAFEVVGKAQKEAGLSVGLSSVQTFLLILLPQMFKVSLPNIGNTIIYLFKEGTLAYTIGLQDVLGRAFFLSAGERNVYLLETYLALTFIYWPVGLVIQKGFSLLEKKLEYKRPVARKAGTKSV